MQTGWTTAKLGELIKTLKGYAFKSQWYSDVGVPLVKVGNFTDDSINVEGLSRIPHEISAGYLRYALASNEVIIQTVGSWPSNPQSVVGKVIRVPIQADGFLLNQNAVKIIPNGSIDIRFLFYSLKLPAFKNYIVGCAQGAASQASVTLDAIKNYDFTFPAIDCQRKIATILSAYDDLIENNTRRIQILEEMARRIYDDWFVKFQFPRNENVKRVEIELRLIPDGWSLKKLDEVATINGLSVKRGKEPSEILYVDIASVSTGRINNIQAMPFNEAPGRARRIVKHGDIIWSNVRPNRKSYALITTPPQNMVVSTGFTVISPSSVPFSYLYQALTTEDFANYLTNRAKGSAYPAVGSEDFAEAKVVIPNAETLSSFDEIAEPLQFERNLLLRKNDLLRRTRDLLLPKLLSGGIEVSNVPNQ
jgi:type I restriction enzyme, S subunit